jgi:hypothetical protein
LREAEDAAGKANLLAEEVAFNEDLVHTVEHVQAVQQTLLAMQEAINEDELAHAVSLLAEATERLGVLSRHDNTQFIGLLKSKVADLRTELAERLGALWNVLIWIDTQEGAILIKQELQGTLRYIVLERSS